MPAQTANWEDEENNRIVQLSVKYQLTESRIEIENVTPVSILFIDAATQTPHRRIRVCTDKGRALLCRQHAAAGGIEMLRDQLEANMLAGAR